MDIAGTKSDRNSDKESNVTVKARDYHQVREPKDPKNRTAGITTNTADKSGASSTTLKTQVTGKVLWFDARLGYGFIERDDINENIFVHKNAVVKTPYSSNPLYSWSPDVTVQVKFDVAESYKGTVATNLMLESSTKGRKENNNETARGTYPNWKNNLETPHEPQPQTANSNRQDANNVLNINAANNKNVQLL